jgi:hypothetical protein
VAEIRLQRMLRVPADPAAEALGELLTAISNQEGPWRGFALHVSFGDLRLPDIGYVAVPIRLTIIKQSKEARTFEIAFESANLPAAFPGYKGTMSVEPAAALGESTMYLHGTYDPPMPIVGKFLDAALAPGVAERSLENFLEEVGAAVQARVDQREAEFARYHFYAQTLR